MKSEINHRRRNEEKNNYMEIKQYATENLNGSTMESKRKLNYNL